MGRAEFAGTSRFVLRRRLGEGGMGVVFAAYDTERRQLVALKTLQRADPRAILRFKNEFRALHDIEHPNLVSLYELFEHDGVWFFTMELVEGVDFLTHVRGPEPRDALDEAELRAAMGQLVRGVVALHRANRVHRDIKPSNVLVTREGRVVLLDFGLVAPATSSERTTQGVVGTVSYMAPELALSDTYGPAADWYSVGVVLYEALTGRLPHPGRNPLRVLLDKQQPPERSPRDWAADVPVDLDALAMRLLAPRPEDRPTATELVRHFRTAKGARPSSTSSVALGLQRLVFVGRGEELATLRDAYEESRSEPVVVLVAGASGLGKSELTARFVEALRRESPATVVLSGRCYERDSVAFKAFDSLIDELSRYLVQLPKDAAAALLPMRAALLPRLFPVLQRVEAIAGAPPEDEPSDAQELRRQVFGALRELLVRLAKRARLVLVIDDLQWTDRDSLALLQEVLDDPTSAPRALLVATMRPVEPELADRLAASLRGPRTHTITLGPLPPEDARALAAALLPSADSATLDAVAREADGYPLFIQELGRHVGSARVRAEGVDLDAALWARISQLPADLLAVLEVVCTASARLSQEMAAHAAELSHDALFRAAAILRAALLVRTTGAHPSDLIEPYHDRIRETVYRHLSPSRRRECHRRLALALARADAASSAPHALVGHTLAAGDAAGAARHAEAAARDALGATAFDRAVDFFRTALELGEHAEPHRRALQLELARALSSAGRGAESAAAFDAAAEGADPATRRDCQRLAAEQLLISGHIEQALARLEGALTELGEPIVATPRHALLAVLWRRLRLAVRGIGWTERSASEISEAERAKLQVVGAAALGLSMVDSIRGAAFNARFAQLALATGDPVQVARALGTEATMSAYQGKFARAAKMGRAVEQIAARHPGDPYIGAWSAIARGGLAYFEGDFASGEAAMRAAGELLTRVGGTTWERNNTAMFVLFCLRYRGELTALKTTAEALHRDAARRGDLYMQVSVRRYAGRYGSLARDRPTEALEDLERTEWPAPKHVFHLQDWQRLEARCEIALYAGRAAEVRPLAEEGFEALGRSMLLRILTVRNPAAFVRARLRLASAPSADDLRFVERTARQLEREGGYVVAWAHLLSAGVAFRRGDAGRSVEHLREAEAVSARYGMTFHRAVAARRLAALTSGDEAAGWRRESEAWMRSQRVQDPARMADILAPGWDGA